MEKIEPVQFSQYLAYEKEKLALQMKDLSPQEFEQITRDLAKRMGI